MNNLKELEERYKALGEEIERLKKEEETKPASLTVDEFVRLHCHECGTQRCEGIGTEWFDGCQFRFELYGYTKPEDMP